MDDVTRWLGGTLIQWVCSVAVGLLFVVAQKATVTGQEQWGNSFRIAPATRQERKPVARLRQDTPAAGNDGDQDLCSDFPNRLVSVRALVDGQIGRHQS